MKFQHPVAVNKPFEKYLLHRLGKTDLTPGSKNERILPVEENRISQENEKKIASFT
jgi:hypothetical protein